MTSRDIVGSVMNSHSDAAANTAARNEYRDKLRSLGFVSRPASSKVTVDHTDTAVVTTTEKNESQDVHVVVDPVRPHWKDQKSA